MIYKTVLEMVDAIEPGHAERVSQLSYQLACEIGLGQVEAKEIQEASRYHDIGKISVPKSILKSARTLTDRERRMAEKHVDYGLGLLRVYEGMQGFKRMRDILATHHERWDGSGYPRGLKGDEIPLCGRIVALCDVFDALTSPRTYKDTWSVQDALAYIQKSSGTLFDLALTERFIQMIKRHTPLGEGVII